MDKGSTKALRSGLTYDVTVNYTDGYLPNGAPLQKTSGEGTIVSTSYGGQFTVGGGNATLYASSKQAAYMQDYTKETCQAEASSEDVHLIDRRDGKIYFARYINGNCWMTQNLRYLGDSGSTSDSMTIKAATTNISSDKSITYYDLDSDGDSGEKCFVSGDGSYRNACIKDSGNTSTGVWYNYAAATAMTISGDSNSTNATEDICPKNWRLPANSEQLGITSYEDAYSPVTGGYYYNGYRNYTEYGHWWSATASATASGASYRHYLGYDGSSLITGYGSREVGYFVRCIRSS